mmetsp:Transcript_32455/g.84092  ORF Transcript_32455/g.84092 Transcript_32455/m.84092 type:complete len:454 (-) Transcript_32455:346-1707(-)
MAAAGRGGPKSRRTRGWVWLEAQALCSPPSQRRRLTKAKYLRMRQRVCDLRAHLIPVVGGLEGAVGVDIDVAGLLLAELGQLGAQLVQVQRGDLLVQVLGQHVHLLLVLAAVALIPQLQLRDDLVGEGAGHDERGVACRAAQVEQTALRQDDDGVAVGEGELVHLGLDVHALDAGVAHQASHVNLVIEVTNVTDDGVVLHLGHVLGHDDVLVSGGCDKDVGERDALLEGGHLVAVHACLQRADRVDLADQGTGTGSLHGHGATLADVTESGNEGDLAGKHDVGGAHDAVGEGVAAAVNVVKLGLGHRVVDVDGGEQQGAAVLHLIQALHAGGGLLRHTTDLGGHLGPLAGVGGQALLDDLQHNLELRVVGAGGVRDGAVLLEQVLSLAALVDEEGGVTAIVHNQVAAVRAGPVEALLSAPPVLLQGLALPGKARGAIARDGSSGVVLGGEDVA